MRITLLGTGGPRPDPNRQGPATLIETAGLRLLVDAGRGVATQLVRAGVNPEQLDAVLLTHHHYDHIGGLGDLLMAAWNNGRRQRLPVYGPSGTEAIVAALLADVYGSDIRFRIREAELIGAPVEPVTRIVEAFDIESGHIDPGYDIRIEVGRVEHGESALGLAGDSWSAVGYRIIGRNRTVTIAGDAVAGKDLGRLAHRSDALVICCYLAGEEIDSDENRFLAEKILAGAPQVAQIANETSVAHLVLTHIRQKPAKLLDHMVTEIRHQYHGEITVGEDLQVLEI